MGKGNEAGLSIPTLVKV